MPKPSDLLQGTLDLLILKVIAAGPLHGWVSLNAFSCSLAMLFP